MPSILANATKKVSKKAYEVESPYFILNDAPNAATDVAPRNPAINTKTMDEARDFAYFTDLYHMFLTRLTKFASEAQTAEVDYKKMRSAFEQVIAIRRKMEGKGPEASL